MWERKDGICFDIHAVSVAFRLFTLIYLHLPIRLPKGFRSPDWVRYIPSFRWEGAASTSIVGHRTGLNDYTYRQFHGGQRHRPRFYAALSCRYFHVHRCRSTCQKGHCWRLLPTQNSPMVSPSIPLVDSVYHCPHFLRPIVSRKSSAVEEQATSCDGRHFLRFVCNQQDC